VKWQDKQCREVRVYPIVLDSPKASRGTRGRPLPATGEVAQDILKRFQELCKPFKTEVALEGESGYITLA
jgi:hypothetical protein